MTTYQTPPTPSPENEVQDPFPNKAIAAALTTIVTVGIQWAASGGVQFSQEGITALGGALATVLVWLVSNWKRRGV